MIRSLLTLSLSLSMPLMIGCATAPSSPAPTHGASPITEPSAPSPRASPRPVTSSVRMETGQAPVSSEDDTEEDRAGDLEVSAADAEPPPSPAPPETVAPEPPWDPDAPVVLSPEVEAHVRLIAARVPRRNEDVFVKVGDSATVSRIYLQCLSRDEALRLDGRDELRPILERFRAASIPGGDPFTRESLAAGVGWSANRPLRGSPTPLAREVRTTNPRFALVMFGSNDVELGRVGRYEGRMEALVERLVAWGVVPVLSTIPQRNDDPEADQRVPRYNDAVRALAQARRLPLIDLNRALEPLPERGLASDGVHPSAPVVDGRARGCDFTEQGLQHGQNVRNLLTLRVLGRLAAVLEEDRADQ